MRWLRWMALGLMLIPARAQNAKVDPNLEPYRPRVEFPVVRAVGSDTLYNLLTFWSEGFSKHHPNVKIPVEGKGSATAPPALTEGLSQLAPMSREMKPEEVAHFERKHGHKPTQIVVAIDALVVFVNKDNPLPSLTLPQVDAIFSRTRKGGHPEDIATWGQAGLKGEWAPAPITLLGRNSLSGTFAYFLEHALYKGAFKQGIKEEADSMAVAWGVAGDRFAIGYSGIGAAGDVVRFLPLDAGRVKAELAKLD